MTYNPKIKAVYFIAFIFNVISRLSLQNNNYLCIVIYKTKRKEQYYANSRN